MVKQNATIRLSLAKHIPLGEGVALLQEDHCQSNVWSSSNERWNKSFPQCWDSFSSGRLRDAVKHARIKWDWFRASLTDNSFLQPSLGNVERQGDHCCTEA